jgi:digeranylgeranylglycerophospholipid reductase
LEELMLYDVVVIGGGPVGSQVAYRLARNGYKVVVVDRKRRLDEPVCCTGLISKECVNRFDIDESVVLRWVNSARLFPPSGKALRVWRQETQACIVDRPALNLALAQRAQERGVEYVLNSPVKSIEVHRDRVRIESGQSGKGQVFEARTAVIANGFNSKLVEGLGMGRIGDFAVGVQAEVETKCADEVEVYLGQEIAPAFFAWLVPTLPHRALVGLLSHRRPGFYLRRLLVSLAGQGKIASSEAEFSYGGVALKPLAKTYRERIIVVGDAAGHVKPTTGGGIYYGLLCADIAADSLHQALENGNLSAKSLANYEKSWKRKLGKELKLGYWGRKFYELLSDRQIDKIFDIIRTNGIDKAFLEEDDLTFDWHSKVVIKLLRHRALSPIVKMVKLPFPGRNG